jgi:hypothetical protein
MTSFNGFMEDVRDELLEKINQLKKQEKEKLKNENIHRITTERDFYKQEAIRLNLICKELNTNNEKLVNENRFLKIDNKNFNNKWREAEKINKHLLIELEKNIERLEEQHAINNNIYNTNQQLLKKDTMTKNNITNQMVNETPENEFQQDKNNLRVDNNYQNIHSLLNSNRYTNKENNNNNKNEFENTGINFNNTNNEFNNTKKNDNMFNYNVDYPNDSEYKVKVLSQINKKLFLEKKKYFKYVKQLTHNNFDKNRLEKTFSDCVEAVKKDIIRRKNSQFPIVNNNKKMGSSNLDNQKFLREYLPETLEKELTKISSNNENDNNFLLKDKYQLLENFLLNDDIINFIKKSVFDRKMDESNALNAFEKTNNIHNYSTNNNTNNNTRSIIGGTANNFYQGGVVGQMNATNTSKYPFGAKPNITSINTINKYNKNYFNKTFNKNKNRLERTIAFG